MDESTTSSPDVSKPYHLDQQHQHHEHVQHQPQGSSSSSTHVHTSHPEGPTYSHNGGLVYPTFPSTSLPQHVHPGYRSAPSESAAFPLPPPVHPPHPPHHHLEQNSHYHEQPQPPHHLAHPPAPPQLANLQSIPFTVSNPNTPRLADLINADGLRAQHFLTSPVAEPSPVEYYSPALEAPSWGPGPPPPRLDEMVHQWGGELPPLAVLLDLADIYFVTIHSHLPFLHRTRFLYSLQNPASLNTPPSLSLVFAVVSPCIRRRFSPSA